MRDNMEKQPVVEIPSLEEVRFAEGSFIREDTAAEKMGMRRKRSRGKRMLAMLGCLVSMAAVVYFTVVICVWIDKRVQAGADEVMGFAGNGANGSDGLVSNSGQTGPAEGEKSPENQGPLENGDAVNAVSSSKIYSQEELEMQIAGAREQAAADVLESIRAGLSSGDTVLQTLRPLYPDDLVVYSGRQYHFVPINYELKQNQWKQECLEILESGEYRYLQEPIEAGASVEEAASKVISYKGIDVSRHQEKIDWQMVAEDGVEFAFIRVGYRGYGSTGRMMEDDYFEANIKGAVSAGIKVGVYFFSQAITEEEVLEEAEFVLNKIAPYKIDCPVVYDVERVTEADGRMNLISVEERTRFAKLFCQKIEEAGYRPMLYYNTEAGAMMLDLEELEDYDKWFASYSDQFYYPYAYHVWQYSQTGRVQGIEGDVDLNISFVPLWEE